MSKNKYSQYFKFCVQRNFQFETHDDKGNQTSDITELDWRKKIITEVKGYMNDGQCDNGLVEIFCAFHDLDINSDGTSKGLHVHFVATFLKKRSQTSAIKFFGASSLQNCEPVKSYVDSLRYLIHVSDSALDDKKTIYLPDVVFGWRIADDGALIPVTVADFKEGMSCKTSRHLRQQQKSVKDSCAVDIMSGNSIVSSVRDAYLQDSYNVGLSAVDYLSDKTIYERASSEWLQMITEFYQRHYCPLTSIYICGGGGTGKTSLANALARKLSDSHGIHQVASAGKKTTFDFVGNYCGERVSVFNEFSTAFPVEQFLSVFDPLNAMPVNSRNKDKLYFANYSIFTTSANIEHFIYQLWIPYAKQNSFIPINVREKIKDERNWYFEYMRYAPPGDDKILQIRRRFPVLVTIDKPEKSPLNVATIWTLDIKSNSPESFRFQSPPNGNEPYVKFRSLVYDVLSENIDSQTDILVDSIIKGIDYYYHSNNLKHPDSFEKPDFSILLETINKRNTGKSSK